MISMYQNSKVFGSVLAGDDIIMLYINQFFGIYSTTTCRSVDSICETVTYIIKKTERERKKKKLGGS